ncbi:hypothetical protein ACFW04_002794 [Cataglyphis niger]
MGNKVATFTEEQLEDYQDCTFFTRKEILSIEIYTNLHIIDQNIYLIYSGFTVLCMYKSMRENPFRERISEVFTRRQDPGHSTSISEGICFEEFLEMMSVFSEQAPRDLKVFYAFKIYDFDEDGVLGMGDLERTCRQLTRGGLSTEEMTTVCRKVLEESDIDGDGALSFLEFEHVVTRASDFMATFHIRI